MRRALLTCLARSAFVITTVALPSAAIAQTSAAAQQQSAAQMSKDDITAFAKVQIAIDKARDSIQAQLAQPRNKTSQAQAQLQDKLRSQIEEILHHSGMTEADYQHKTYVVSTDAAVRKTFDGVVAQLTGVPTPGQVVATAAPAAAAVKVPAGAVGVHIGHVVNGFSDTPMGMSLMATAMAEAKIAATHAGLAARQPGNLDYMKTHAGHVINAVDPTVIATGPGLGYGVKKASLGIATHIELAAKAPGASPNVITHAAHVSAAARSTIARADQVLAVAKQVQAATSAADAAVLVNQLVSLTTQLTAGFDANGDGRIGWQEPEGGLQQAQDHVNLMLKGENLPPK